MIPKAYIVHKVNNRLRIKVPSKRGDRGFFASVEKKFSEPSPEQTIVVNPDTALVLFLGHLTAKHIAETAQESELFKLKTMTHRRETLLGGVKDMFHTADRRLLKMTGGELDIPSVVFLGLISHGIYHLHVGISLVPHGTRHFGMLWAFFYWLQNQAIIDGAVPFESKARPPRTCGFNQLISTITAGLTSAKP